MSSPAATPTPDEDERVSIGCGVLAYAAAVVWLTLCAAGVRTAIEEIRTPAVDVRALCERVTSSPCLSTVPARSDGVGGFRTEDGIVMASLGRTVPAGRRVELEYWAGDFVSVYDLRNRARYRTNEWNQGWGSQGNNPIALLVVSALFAALPLWGVVYASFAVLRLAGRRLQRGA